MTQSKTLFFFLGSFKLGGTERTASRIGLELLKKGHKVKFILLYNIFDYDQPELRDNSFILIPNKGASKLIDFFNAYRKLRGILGKYKPDYLVSFSLLFNIFSFLTFYKKIIFRIESNIFIYKKKKYRRYIQKYIALSPNVKKVVVPSEGLYKKCLQYFYTKKKLIQIANPINISEVVNTALSESNEFIEANKGKYIVSAGRLHGSKGFRQLITVFAKSKLVYDHKLVILGDGPERQNLEQLITSLNLQDKVLLPGYVKNPFCYYINSRFFVLNSDHESFGNVIIEAMACGVPVLSNDCDFGPRSIIENKENGILYQKQNESEFIYWLEQVAYDDKFFSRLKNGALTTIKKFDIEKIAERWLDYVLQ